MYIHCMTNVLRCGVNNLVIALSQLYKRQFVSNNNPFYTLRTRTHTCTCTVVYECVDSVHVHIQSVCDDLLGITFAMTCSELRLPCHVVYSSFHQGFLECCTFIITVVAETNHVYTAVAFDLWHCVAIHICWEVTKEWKSCATILMTTFLFDVVSITTNMLRRLTYV